jgi:DNA mismatch repair protein MutL
MSTIYPLPVELIAKIAAGEVVERPSYALKELIENAIDAKATQISISLTDAGITKMIVDDDGIGMEPEDVEASWKLHTTSKIQSIEQLSAIHTQGFRGEALASIAAIADLTIQSKPADQTLGYEVQIRGQRCVHKGQIGLAPGTRIIVENMFASLPARQQFLHSTQTELRHCVDVVTTYAIAHSHIRFVLRHQGKILLSFPAVLESTARLAALFDLDLVDTLIPIKHQESYVTITGFIAHPSKATASISKQYIFVNTRPIRDRIIARAVTDSLVEIVPKDRNPIFFLHLTVPAELVDINVHPRKEIVRFSSPETIYTAVQTAVQQMLATQALTFQSSLTSEQTTGKITQSIAGQFLKDAVINQNIRILKNTVFSQIHNTYIVLQTHTGMMYIDQHAAQERTLYERFLNEFKSEQKKNKTIPLRIALSLSQSDIILLQEHKEKFNSLGFTFEEKKVKKQTRIYITSIPILFSDRDPVPIIEEIFSDLRTGIPIRDIDTLTHTMLTYLACRSSVKAGDVLTQKQMKQIVSELQATPNKFACPHGRPTMIEVPLTALHKLFKRL